MSKRLWAVGFLVGWTACGQPGSNGTEEQDTQATRDCLLQRLAPAEGTSTPWKVSGYVVVETYRQCKPRPEQASAADFRAVMEGMAVPDEDPAFVWIDASRGRTP